MKLNHLNLSVTNVQGARRLLEKYFQLISIPGTNDTDTFIAMKDADDFVLTLMEKKEELHYPEPFHIGFLKQGDDRVYELYQKLKDDGYHVNSPKHYHGKSLDLYFNTPFGFTIQVSG